MMRGPFLLPSLGDALMLQRATELGCFRDEEPGATLTVLLEETSLEKYEQFPVKTTHNECSPSDNMHLVCVLDSAVVARNSYSMLASAVNLCVLMRGINQQKQPQPPLSSDVLGGEKQTWHLPCIRFFFLCKTPGTAYTGRFKDHSKRVPIFFGTNIFGNSHALEMQRKAHSVQLNFSTNTHGQHKNDNSRTLGNLMHIYSWFRGQVSLFVQ